jgi:hypothetical protein
MTRSIFSVLAILSWLAVPLVAIAGDDRGKVEEILIKIQTEDGPKWFTLGKGKLVPAEFGEGDVVQFDYADDGTIQSIEVAPQGEGSSENKE